MTTWLLLLTAAVMIAACGAFVAAEFSFVTVDRNQVERLLGEVAVHDLEVPAEV